MHRLVRLTLLVVLLVLGAAAPASARTKPCLVGAGGGPMCHVWTGKVVSVADGDTVDVDVRGDRTRHPLRVRLTGIQAMEQTVYSSRASRRRGECHALAATARLERLVRAGRGVVRLAAQRRGSRTGRRWRRSLAVRRPGGGWRDAGAVLVRQGHALWLPNGVEWAWNARYAALARAAADAGRGLWRADACGAGPAAGVPLSLRVNWDADGADAANVNGEWFRVRNAGASDVSLGGWWVRDSHLRRYRFPSWAVVPAGGSVTVHVGRGLAGGGAFFWGLDEPVFENATHDARAMGDGGYLFDPQGDLRAWQQYP